MPVLFSCTVFKWNWISNSIHLFRVYCDAYLRGTRTSCNILRLLDFTDFKIIFPNQPYNKVPVSILILQVSIQRRIQNCPLVFSQMPSIPVRHICILPFRSPFETRMAWSVHDNLPLLRIQSFVVNIELLQTPKGRG